MRYVVTLACIAVAGCSLDPHYVRPEPPVPAGWPAGDAYLKTSEAMLPTVRWTDVFRDPKLQEIIRQALENNRDLRVALANIESARAEYRVQRAQLLPQIDANGRASYIHAGNDGVVPTTGTVTGGSSGTGVGTGISGGTGSSGGTGVGTGTGGTGTGGTGTGGTGTGGTGTTGTGTSSNGVSTNTNTTASSYTVNLGLASFEIDLFGRLRSLSRAALQTYLATESAARTTRLTLVGEVATAYLTLATDRSLLAIAVDTETSAGRTVALTQARLTGGIAPRTDLRQAETILAQARSDRAAQVTLVAQDRNALELLVGAPVADDLLPPTIESVDSQIAALPAGLDSRVLLRRPDVVQAEYVLRAANARIGAARANFFPTISLTALAGFGSTALSSLFTGGAFSWSVIPSATLPVFDGGANSGNLAYAKAQRDLAIAEYQQAIQTAFREVADALARRGTIEQQLAAQVELEAAAQDSNTLETARYQAGVDPYLNSLDSQRTLYTARRALVSTRLIRASAFVTLYRVLGGDQLVSNGDNLGVAH